MDGPGARYFFVHLQKTAGTSLWARLRRCFADPAIYPNHTDRSDPVAAVISVEHLRRRWAARGEEIRLLTGHFPLCVADVLGGGFRTFTVLRSPYERTVSYLEHHRQVTASDRDLTLEQIYDDPDRFHGLVHNHMVKMLSLTPDEMDDGALTRVRFSPQRLERAKERLATVDVVGLQEHFEDFCDDLGRRFGWDLGDPVVSNRTKTPAVAPALRERVLADNAADTELYDFARRLVRERAGSH